MIYDNACNLYDYIMNRDPLMFKNTMFLSDRLHWPNHNNCSAVYNPELYSLVLNTVLHESQNSRLTKLKALSYFMRFDTYVELLVNLILSLNLRPPTSRKEVVVAFEAIQKLYMVEALNLAEVPQEFRVPQKEKKNNKK